MAERIVIDTGPLISLSRAKLLDYVAKLPFDFICPMEVCKELETGLAAGYRSTRPDWVTPVPLKQPLDRVALTALDMGEASVIQLALEQSIGRVCIDERKGRRVALAVGLQVTGSLGLLGKAKLLGIIPELRPEIEKLKNVGMYYGEGPIREILRGVGEE